MSTRVFCDICEEQIREADRKFALSYEIQPKGDLSCRNTSIAINMPLKRQYVDANKSFADVCSACMAEIALLIFNRGFPTPD